MNLFKRFHNDIVAVVEGLVAEHLLPPGLDTGRITAEPPRDPAHGDISTNAALVLAKGARMKPRELAEMLAGRLGKHGGVISAEVAGAGFINLRLDDGFWRDRLIDVLDSGTAYGDSDIGKDAGKVNVEFVSANPTGPLHIGHGRGAVFGDVLASLLEKAGFDVTREYYINDAGKGGQIEALARSVYHRYREALGEDPGEMAEGLYPGDYLIPVGRALAETDGDKWLSKPEAKWTDRFANFSVDKMMAFVRDDLEAVGISFDVFTYERNLHQKGKVEKAVDWLEEKDLIFKGTLPPPKGRIPEDYEEGREQLLFRATDFGDDVDRPLTRGADFPVKERSKHKNQNEMWTYFAADIAYHRDKFDRGFATMIDVWGADHGGYVKRMKAAVAAITEGKGELDVKICQLVNLSEGGKPVRMSKRAGDFVTLREVVDRVGKDVVRFIMLTRRNDAPLDFDLEKVTEQSRDNPVFYVQYAHARAHSIFRHAHREFPGIDISPHNLAKGPLERLTRDDEIALIKLLTTWPRQVESAAETHEPHRIAFFLLELAAAFHGLWNKGNDDASLRFLVPGDEALTAARLALVRGVALVIASGLGVLGVEPVEELR
ncbi:MAG: arginine--tRNA ligase [Proteobacteria bacterium]|nr:arginine--tRNA ligase [Pseudomonadota bacterium]